MAKVDQGRANEAQQWVETILGRSLGSDFFEEIKDGVALCEVVNKIQPGTCKKFKKSSVAYVARTNIQIYLEGCKKLGVPETDRFESRDLYDKQRLGAVVDNIFSLSAASRKSSSFKGPFIGVKYHDENKRNFSAEVLAKSKSAVPAWNRGDKEMKTENLDGYGIVRKQGIDKHQGGRDTYGAKDVKAGNKVDGYGIVKLQGIDKHHGGKDTYGAKDVSGGNKVDGYGIVKLQGIDKHSGGKDTYGAKDVQGGNKVDGYGIVKLQGIDKHSGGKDTYGAKDVQGGNKVDGYGIVKLQGIDKHSGGQDTYGAKNVDGGNKVDGYGIVKLQGIDKHSGGQDTYGAQQVDSGAKMDAYGINKNTDKN